MLLIFKEQKTEFIMISLSKMVPQWHIIALFIVFMLMQSCFLIKEEGCTDPKAENYDSNADKSNGTCTYKRDKYVGIYTVNENCNSGNFSYTLTIAESVTGTDAVVVRNLGGFNLDIKASVGTASKIFFSDTQNSITFSGEGDINGSTLTIIYTASQGTSLDNCTSIGIKQ